MDIKVNINISRLTADDFKDEGGRAQSDILMAVLDEAKVAVDAFEEQRWAPFIRYCHTGRFD